MVVIGLLTFLFLSLHDVDRAYKAGVKAESRRASIAAASVKKVKEQKARATVLRRTKTNRTKPHGK